MLSACVRVRAFSQFAVLYSRISQACLRWQMEQVICCVEMTWDVWAKWHVPVLLCGKWRGCQKQPKKQVVRLKIVLRELHERRIGCFHSNLPDIFVEDPAQLTLDQPRQPE